MDLFKVISEARPELSQMSIKTYVNCLNKILEYVRSNDAEILFKSPEQIIKVILDMYENNNSIKTKLSSVIVLLRILKNDVNKNLIDNAINKYTQIIELSSTKVNEANATNQKTPRQEQGWTTDEESDKLLEILKSKVSNVINTPSELRDFRNYILYLFYRVLPSRAELADSKILFKTNKVLSDEYNYIILDKQNKSVQYIMNNYKTAKNYGCKTIKLPDDYFNVLLKYKKSVDKYNNNNYFLLNDTATEKLTRNRLGVIYTNLGKEIGKKLSISVNRHIAISKMVPIQQMKDLANVMGNSTNEQIGVYAKV